MKMLSLKLDEEIFRETEKLTLKLKKPRNRYINEALDLYNKYNERMLLKKQLHKESKLVSAESSLVLSEFEKIREKDEEI
jgi:predicted transcriptional regulator